MASVRTHAQDLADFISASPSPFHAAHAAAARLDGAGFTRLDESGRWAVDAGKYYVIRDGAVIAWITPQDPAARRGVRILGSHTDSPGFKLKPHAGTGSRGWLQAGVEVYGGPLLNSWLDRELCLAGRLVSSDGTEHLVATGPLARFPQLAIHLDRTANESLKLDKQQVMQPIWGAGHDGADLLGHLASLAVPGTPGGTALTADDVVGYDIVVADTQAPRLFGRNEEFLAAGRLDNLSSVHAGLTALLTCPDPEQIVLLAGFDHEEIGSGSRSGAAGPFLEDVLVRISAGLDLDAAGYRQLLSNSVCLSADAGHLVHPNYPGHHDPVNQPLPGGGPLLKINANQRYATDAVGAGIWAAACARADVPYQEFVSNNNIPCGSTIGPLTATRLGIRTIDVGLGLLSMHSAREMCHIDDAYSLTRAIGAFFVPAEQSDPR